MRRFAPAADKGFTLFELLVVVLLIGIISSIVLLSVRLGGEERLLNEELRRIDRLLSLARDEARFRMLDLGMEFGADGYRFVVMAGNDWIPIPEPGPLRQRPWPPETSVTLQVDGMPVDLDDGLTDDDIAPQALIQSSGEVSPFVLRMETASGHHGSLVLHLTGDTEREIAGARQ